jgi:O-antigen/teichoic acid export membrane protein
MVHLARVVGPAVFGAWGLAQAWMMYLFRVGEMGYEVAGIRAIATKPRESARTIVWNVLGVRMALAVVSLAAVAVAVWFSALPAESGTLLLILSLALFPVALVLEWVFESHQEVGSVGIARVLKGVLFGVLVLAFVRTSEQVTDAAWYYVVSLVVPTVVVFGLAMSRFELWPPRFSWPQLRALTREAFPIGIATVLSQFTLFAGTFIAGYTTSPERLGYYTAGHRLIIFIWAYGIVTSNRVILPQLSRLHTDSAEDFAAFVLKYFRILAIVAVPIVICAIAGGDEVVRLLFGASYSESAMVFKILSMALGCAVIRSVLEIGLVASRRQQTFMHGMIGLVVAYVAFTVAGLALWDINGAAWAAVAAELLYAMYLIVVFKSVGVGVFLRSATKPVLSGAVVLLVVYLTGLQSLPVVVAASLGGYLLLLIGSGELSRKEILFLTSRIPGRAKSQERM